MQFNLTILPGQDRSGKNEIFHPVTLEQGDTLAIVGPTGSGKTALIADIELMAQGDTSTKRKILINGELPPDEIRYNPALKPVVMITQNTKCFTDLTVEEFINVHARARKVVTKAIVLDTLNLANTFTGEKIECGHRVTTLSGGQTRSLLIADAIMIGAAPIILLDEIENAGIYRENVVDTIHNRQRIAIFVTHDPVIALMCDRRIVMRNGGIAKVYAHGEAEKKTAKALAQLNIGYAVVREKLRTGERIRGDEIEGSDRTRYERYFMEAGC